MCSHVGFACMSAVALLEHWINPSLEESASGSQHVSVLKMRTGYSFFPGTRLMHRAHADTPGTLRLLT